jgi:DNA-binding beta-propeller fold protein YncE
MKQKQLQKLRGLLLLALIISLTALSNQIKADTGTCGGVTITLPFNDVMASPFFCQIAAAYFSGLTNGTTATTYSPTQTVTREQMAAFISRTLDQSLKRSSQRAVAKKWWTPQTAGNLTLTDIGNNVHQVEFDGTDLWVTDAESGTVKRIRTSDGKVLDTWTGANFAGGLLCAMGRVFVTGGGNPGTLYMIDPTQPAGMVTTVSSNLGNSPVRMTFDGARIWIANMGGSVSIISLNPVSVTTVSTGFNRPSGILFDGSNIWVTDFNANTLLKLNSDGSIAQTLSMLDAPHNPVFDGTNIWIPHAVSPAVILVRVKDASGNSLPSAFLLSNVTGNGLNGSVAAAFDGERILVTNQSNSSVSLWKAADLTPLGNFPTGPSTLPSAACSDGLNFWIVLNGSHKLARF